MKIMVLPRPREGVSREAMEEHGAAEIQAVWDLYAQGVCRELYTRAGQPGRVVLMVESASVEAARHALAALPFVRLGLIDLELIPLGPFTGLSRLFQAAS
jgi:muconolactone delta-isomerase